MKKNMFYLAIAAFVALANVACSSDDDGAENYTPTLDPPKYETEAVVYTIPETADIQTSVPDAPAMTAVNITESGQAVFELDGGKTFKVYNIASMTGDTYTLEANRGTIKMITATMAPTRATSTVQLVINVTIELDNGQSCNYNTGEDGVPAQASTPPPATDVETLLCRTWNVLNLAVEYQEDGKEGVFREFDNGNLNEVAAYANDQGAGLTPDELAELDRIISTVVIERSGLLLINYTNRNSDAAQWSWANSEKTQLKIQLKDSEMGNKFLSDKTVIDLAFKDTRCVLKLKNRITGNPSYNMALIIRLQSKD